MCTFVLNTNIKEEFMNASEQTLQQIERALKKVATKFHNDEDNMPLTDIFLQVKQESGELLAFNDDDVELTRCVVEEWIGNSSETFYDEVQPILKKVINCMKDTWDNLPVLKPYSFVLIGEDKETIADLYLVDDDLLVIDGDLMKGLSADLDDFWNHLSNDKDC